MSIDLGNNPVGSTPTDAQKTQLRSSIGLGSADTVEFGALIPPAGTTAEINAVANATVGQVMIDTDRNLTVRFTSSSSYETINTPVSVVEDSLVESSAISLQDARFFESGLVPSTNDVFGPNDFITIFSDDSFDSASSSIYIYHDGTQVDFGIPAGWINFNNQFAGEVTAPVIVPNKAHRITFNSLSDQTDISFSFNKIVASDTSSQEMFSKSLFGGAEYKVELTINIGDLAEGNLRLFNTYTGVLGDSTISFKVEDTIQQLTLLNFKGKLIENDTYEMSKTTKIGVDSPKLGVYTITMVLRPTSDGVFTFAARQSNSDVNPLLIDKAETTVTNL